MVTGERGGRSTDYLSDLFLFAGVHRVGALTHQQGVHQHVAGLGEEHVGLVFLLRDLVGFVCTGLLRLE